MPKSNIAIAREMRGMTQAALAAAVGVAASHVGRWEQGERTPKREHAIELAKALDVDVAWISGCPITIPVPDRIDNTMLHLPVIRTEEIEDYGTLYIVCVDDVRPLAVIMGDGVTIVRRDWEAAQPLCAADIADLSDDYSWLAPDGSTCVMFDGLPRVGWWV